MADYGADPGGHKYDGLKWKDYEVNRQKALEARVKELEAEVKRLKGIQTYKVDIYELSRYEVDAASSEEAEQKVLDQHGIIVPKSRTITEVSVESA